MRRSLDRTREYTLPCIEDGCTTAFKSYHRNKRLVVVDSIALLEPANDQSRLESLPVSSLVLLNCEHTSDDDGDDLFDARSLDRHRCSVLIERLDLLAHRHLPLALVSRSHCFSVCLRHCVVLCKQRHDCHHCRVGLPSHRLALRGLSVAGACRIRGDCGIVAESQSRCP